jgi:hypothetical protein
VGYECPPSDTSSTPHTAKHSQVEVGTREETWPLEMCNKSAGSMRDNRSSTCPSPPSSYFISSRPSHAGVCVFVCASRHSNPEECAPTLQHCWSGVELVQHGWSGVELERPEAHCSSVQGTNTNMICYTCVTQGVGAN